MKIVPDVTFSVFPPQVMDNQTKRKAIQKPLKRQQKNPGMVASKLKDPKNSLVPPPPPGRKKDDSTTFSKSKGLPPEKDALVKDKKVKKDKVAAKKDGVTEKSDKQQKKTDLKMEDKVSKPKEKAKELKPVKAAEEAKAKGGKKVIKKGDGASAKPPKESMAAKKKGETATKDKMKIGKAVGEDFTGKTAGSLKKEEKNGKKEDKTGKIKTNQLKSTDTSEQKGDRKPKKKMVKAAEGRTGKQKEGKVDEPGKKDMKVEKTKKLLEVPKSGRQKEGVKTDRSPTGAVTKTTKPKDTPETRDNKTGKPNVGRGIELKVKSGGSGVVKNTLQRLANANVRMQLERAKMAPMKESRPKQPQRFQYDKQQKPTVGQARIGQQMPAKGGTIHAPLKPIRSPGVLKKAEGDKRPFVVKKGEESKNDYTGGFFDAARNLDNRQTIVGKQTEEEAQNIKIYLSKHTDELLVAEDKDALDAVKFPEFDSKDYSAAADTELKYSLHSFSTKQSLEKKVSGSKPSDHSGSHPSHSTKVSDSKLSTVASGTKRSHESKVSSSKHSQDSKQVSLNSIKESTKSSQKHDGSGKYPGSQSAHSYAGVNTKYSEFSGESYSRGHDAVKQKEEEIASDKSGEEQLQYEKESGHDMGEEGKLETAVDKEGSDVGKEIENEGYDNKESEDESEDEGDDLVVDSNDDEANKTEDDDNEDDDNEGDAPHAEQDYDEYNPDEEDNNGDEDNEDEEYEDDDDQNQKDEDKEDSGSQDESDGQVSGDGGSNQGDNDKQGEEEDEYGEDNQSGDMKGGEGDQESKDKDGHHDNDQSEAKADGDQDNHDNKEGGGADDGGSNFFGDD